MNTAMLTQQFIVLIITSVALGTIARALTLVIDYRQYPSFPNGYLIHLVTGFVASAIGAIAVPAVIARDFQAFTFLALALEQFREIRRIENESLQALDEGQYISRGNAYIDGIAKTFEARSYFSLLVAFASSLAMELVSYRIMWVNVICGIAAGAAAFIVLRRLLKGNIVADIAEVKAGNVVVSGSELYVDGIFITNHIGMDEARELVEKEAIAAVVYPKHPHYRITLDNIGQRQAILFEACRALGLKRYHFTRGDYESGRTVFVLVPIINDVPALVETVKRTPLLESVKKDYKVMKSGFLK